MRRVRRFALPPQISAGDHTTELERDQSSLWSPKPVRRTVSAADAEQSPALEVYSARSARPYKSSVAEASIELSRDRRAWHGSGRGRWSTAGSSGCAPGWSRPSCSCTRRSRS